MAARREAVRRAVLALTLSLAASSALAQGTPQPRAQEDRPRRHTPQAPQPAAGAAVDAAGLPRSGAPARPTGGGLKPRLVPAPVLSSAVRSRYSLPARIAAGAAGQCRTRCAEARGQCFNADSVETSGCDPAWTRCLSTCEGLTYSRAP